jgi:FlaA1/EpsC-like NDP-sugar epimerase
MKTLKEILTVIWKSISSVIDDLSYFLLILVFVMLCIPFSFLAKNNQWLPFVLDFVWFVLFVYFTIYRFQKKTKLSNVLKWVLIVVSFLIVFTFFGAIWNILLFALIVLPVSFIVSIKLKLFLYRRYVPEAGKVKESDIHVYYPVGEEGEALKKKLLNDLNNVKK